MTPKLPSPNRMEITLYESSIHINQHPHRASQESEWSVRYAILIFKRVNTVDAITLNLPFFLISYYTVKGIDSKFIWQTLKMQKTFL